MPETEPTSRADVRIRTARRDEASDVLEFWHVAAEGTSITDDVEGVARLLGRDPDSLLLAEDAEGRLLGSVIAGFDGWRCHLYRLAVHPAARRRGVARALLAAAEERFVSLGGRRGDAMVLQGNAPAHAVWRAAGYAPQQEWRRWVRPLP
ncbi:GNAT family N-acetyltransferase [Streptomyces xiaopingdaonensis]|uniref:GNAT family N-acetyltransferase n=1 Tax=Streptomyces xiaopingdaonensis TaxID=1565415 RepID=UPI0002F36FDD